MKVLFSLMYRKMLFKRTVNLPFPPFPGLGWHGNLLYEVDFVKVTPGKGTKCKVACTVKFHNEYRGLTDKQIRERITRDGFKQYA